MRHLQAISLLNCHKLGMLQLLFLWLFVVAEGHVYTNVQNAAMNVSMPSLPPQRLSIISAICLTIYQ